MAQFTSADITKLMSQIPKGKSNAINAPDLAVRMGFSPAPNQEELRALIRMALDNGELIGSSSSGYWIMDSLQELEEVLNSLEGRAQGTCDRRNSLLDSWNSKNPTNQSSLCHVDVKP